MRYVFDHDFHIHSKISLCSNDEKQTTQRILQYAEENNLKTICLTDHFWDENVKSNLNDFYERQNFAHIEKALPLPKSEKCEFLFGCEIDMDKDFNIGISEKMINKFDFIVIPTTHLHMNGFTIKEDDNSVQKRCELWIKRFETLLNMNLPFNKVGIAHLACGLIAPTREEYIQVLKLLPKEKLYELFEKAAKLSVGIEINSYDMSFSKEEADIIISIFKIAKEQGCKFYFGSDAHHPDGLDRAKAIFENAIDLLKLTEDDKFTLVGGRV